MSDVSCVSEGCPTAEGVDEVLDREAAPADDRRVRRHVAGCPRCQEEFGALFEIDALGPALGPTLGPSVLRQARPARWGTGVPAAIAAGLLLAALLAIDQSGQSSANGPGPDSVDSRAARVEAPPPRLLACTITTSEFVVTAAAIRLSARQVEDRTFMTSLDFTRSATGTTDWRVARAGEPSIGGSPAAPEEMHR